MQAIVAGIAVLGPGLPDWPSAASVLSGRHPYRAGDVVLPPPAILSATERRRTGPVVRLALAAATVATAASGLDPATLRPVFGTANGDSPTVTSILDAITRRDGFVSPTQFHNSVHNAAAGYWSIGTGSRRPATCLGCHDWTFAAALMKAVAECQAEREPVLLCVYDVPMPSPVDVQRPTQALFAAAFVLRPDGAGPRLRLGWSGEPAGHPEPLTPALRGLAAQNPAARSLRLLEALARGVPDQFSAALLDGHLRIELHP